MSGWALYPIKIEFAGVPITVEAERAISAKLTKFGLLLIIGRDVLSTACLCTRESQAPSHFRPDLISMSVNVELRSDWDNFGWLLTVSVSVSSVSTDR